jgi:hypothetical protein
LNAEVWLLVCSHVLLANTHNNKVANTHNNKVAHTHNNKLANTHNNILANTHNNKLATYHSWFATPFSRNERMPINVPRYLHLDLSKHVKRNVSRFRLCAHTLKVEAAAWLEDGSRVCDKCPGEDEQVQNKVHALLFCQDHRVCELRKQFSFLLTPFFEDCSAAQPFLFVATGQQPTCSWLPFLAEH